MNVYTFTEDIRLKQLEKEKLQDLNEKPSDFESELRIRKGKQLDK